MLKSGSRRLSQYFWHWLADNLALLTSLTISNTNQLIDTYHFPSARNFDCSCRYSHDHNLQKLCQCSQLNWDTGAWTSTVILNNSLPSALCNGVQSRHTKRRADSSSPIQSPSAELIVHQDVRGPYLQCAEPNSTQIPIFNY